MGTFYKFVLSQAKMFIRRWGTGIQRFTLASFPKLSLVHMQNVFACTHVLKITDIFSYSLAHLSLEFKWDFLFKICPVVIIVINFPHFHHLPQKHITNFNQTRNKHLLYRMGLKFCLFFFQMKGYTILKPWLCITK